MKPTLLEELEEAVRHVPDQKLLEHEQYIEGTLYVTPEQYRALWRWDGEQPIDYGSGVVAMGIPVVVVKANGSVLLPSGKTLVYSEILRAFCVLQA